MTVRLFARSSRIFDRLEGFNDRKLLDSFFNIFTSAYTRRID